ncbi:YhhN domain-containing protein [Histoplasma capsulatum var. duboisii H88]|uniref:YhhN domain-containing protein n=1 Tax=Ajellomyces capsulatus (strain H88) TaxID=544711 RepID=F0UQQ3_AJEC8|nr:YhhN domain-containing protein [Histoplasma capsulatum var. duboisii H88]
MPALSLPPPPTIRLLNTSLPLLILSERLAFYPGSCVFKLVSSAAFLAGPLYYLAPSPSPLPSLSLSPLDWRQWHPYHLRIAAGLLFSAVGDYCLIPARAEYYEKHTGPLAARKERAGDGHGDNDDNDEEEEEAKKPSTSVKVGVCAFAAAHAAYILAFLQDNSHSSSSSSSSSTAAAAAAAAAGSSFSRPIFTSTFAAAMLLARWLGVIYPPANGNGERKQHKTKTTTTTTTNGPQRLLRTNVLNLAIPADMRALVGGYAAIISGMLAVAASTATATATAWPYQRALGAAMFVASDLFVAEDMFGRRRRRRRGGVAGRAQRAQRPGWLRPALGFGLYFWAQMVIAGTVGED